MSRIGSCVSIDEDDVLDAGSDFRSVLSHRSSSSLLSFPSFLSIDGAVRRSFSYDKLPLEPINLSILKLDSSSFDVRVMGTATVRELKEAVESAFDHKPKKGPGKISWRHVWGHFCLCYDGQKLLNESDLIVKYGIKDADQLQIIRHISSTHVIKKKRSSKRRSSSEQRNRSSPRSSCSDDGAEVNYAGDESDDGDLEKGNGNDYKKSEDDSTGHWNLELAQFLRGRPSQYSQLPTGERGKTEENYRPSRCNRFWKIVIFCGGE